MSLYITNSKGGEMTPLDLSRLAYPPTPNRHNRPVQRRRYRYMRPADRETVFVLVLLCLVTLALSLAG